MQKVLNKNSFCVIILSLIFCGVFVASLYLFSNSSVIFASSITPEWRYVTVTAKLADSTPVAFKENINWFLNHGFKDSSIVLNESGQVVSAQRYTKCGSVYGELPTIIEGFDPINWSVVGKGQTITAETEFNYLEHITIVLNVKFHEYPIVYTNCEGAINTNSTFHTIQNDVVIGPASKVGYDFLGWTTKRQLEPSLNYTITSNVTETVELKANWRAHSFFVAFNGNGAIGEMENQEFIYDTEEPITNMGFINEGKNFVGWAKSGSGTAIYCNKAIVKNLGTEENEIINLYAIWSSQNVYQVKFNANGGSGKMLNQPFAYGEQKSLFSNSLEKKGYTFLSWNTKNDGTGTSYQNAQTVKDLSSTNRSVFELYAIWDENTYTINFQANGGEGDMPNQTFSYTERKALATNTFSKQGFRFLCWNTKSDGSGEAYNNEQVVSKLAENGSITLYAIWREPSGFNISTNAIIVISIAIFVVAGVITTTILIRKKVND